jgi:DNA-directed RNA polymerase specialized sigma24 family protein
MDPTDAQLAGRIRDGDPAAEGEFAARYGAKLRRMMLARARNRTDAEDLAQEALIASLQALRAGRIDSPEHLDAFVHGVGRNVLANLARRAGRRPAEVTLPEGLRASRSRSRISRGSVVGRAVRGVAGLPTTDRAILVLTYWWDRSGPTIAKLLHLRHDAVRARKARALHRLAVAVRRRAT